MYRVVSSVLWCTRAVMIALKAALSDTHAEGDVRYGNLIIPFSPSELAGNHFA
jgi:hypothetical protein